MATDIQISSRKIISVNPATGDVLRELDRAEESDVRKAVERARSAQAAWSAVALRQRLKIVRRFQQLLLNKKTDLARLISAEAGKPISEALTTEVMVVLDSARFCIDNAEDVLQDEDVTHGSLAMKTKSGRMVREPYGVIGIISPWNYPFSIPAGESLAALIAGNTVVLKPSEFTPLIALELASLLHEAGVPPDVFQTVVGDGVTGAALVNSGIDKLIFTGSVATGKRIANAAADRLLPVVLELGGKDPMLVLDDADIEIAASGAIWGAFMNAGQTCLSVERCYVHKSIYDAFLAACVKKTKKLSVGNGMSPQTDVGPMIHERQLRIVESQVEDARARGARVLAGGSRLPELGPNFYALTVLADVTQAMRIMQEETFGPVLPVMAFDTEDEAIRLANDSEYGLAASVWTRNRARGEGVAKRIAAGTVMINDVVSCFGISEAPHGGVKASGIGRTHGRLGLQEMVRVKYVSSELLPGLKRAWWYPYRGDFSCHLNGLTELLYAGSVIRKIRALPRAIGSYLLGKGRL